MSSNAFVSMFGSTLMKGTEEVDTVKALGLDASASESKTKAVGIYFSAHWCPPCRGFTPKLAEWYNKDLKSKGLEVVFVSSDQDEKAFAEYYKEMPWLALKYSERELKNKLSSKFKVRGIPSFVILNTEGEVITMDGRSAVTSDPTGEEFPWIPPTFETVLGQVFSSKCIEGKKEDEKDGTESTSTKDSGKKDDSGDSKKHDVDSRITTDSTIAELFGPNRKNKDLEVVGLYFSAHWCPPCRGFTPKLAETYKTVNADKKKLEIVFITSDRDESSFKEYFETMPWLAAPFKNAYPKARGALSNHFDVNGIPCLVLLDANDMNTVVNKNAVGKVRSDEKGEQFPWAPSLVKEVDEDPEGIDEGLSLVVLQENVTDESEKQKNMDVLKACAQKNKEKKNDVIIFTASKSGRLADRVRSECALKDAGSDEEKKAGLRVVVMNIPEEEYYTFEGELTVEKVDNFFNDIQSKKIQPKEMGA